MKRAIGTIVIGASAVLVFVLVLPFVIEHYGAMLNDIPEPAPSQARARKNLGDCMAELEEQTTGWCEMRVSDETPGISSVWPSKTPRIFQTMGPQAILSAWSSAAYDEQTKTLYFMGGGGTDYGGNEVYSFSLEYGVWRRLTEPSPLDHVNRGVDHRVWIPDTRRVPAASHTHDGLQFSPDTRTLVLLTHEAAIGARLRKGDPGPSDQYAIDNGIRPQQYEFNPDVWETRNGLAPLSWRRIGTEPWGYPRSAVLPDGTLLLGSKKVLYQAESSLTGELIVGKQVLEHGDYGAVYLRWDRKRSMLWFITGRELVAYDSQGRRVRKLPLPFPSPKTIAFDEAGNFVLWDGNSKIYSLNPDTTDARWSVTYWDNARLQQGRRGTLNGKWVAIGKNYFVGLSSHQTGVWLYKHATGQGDTRYFSDTDLNALLQSAPIRSRVKLPPGLYGRGIKISKPLDVDMTGVELMSVYGSKALVVVEAESGPVTVRNLKVDGKRTNATSGNLAAFRISGRSFNVTIENAHVTDTALGLITDNRGGKLHIRDSFFSDIGSGKRRGLSHIIYAGAIDELTVENTVLQRSLRLGHILKSRAQNTAVTQSKLLGLDGRHSRVIDFSCGGRLEVRESVLQNGSRADNSDLISVGVEPEANCKRGLLPGNVTLLGNTIVFDRGLRPKDSETKKRQNRLFTWKTEVAKLQMIDNLLVSPGGAHVFDQAIGDMNLKHLLRSNVLQSTRKQAGLRPELDTDPTPRRVNHQAETSRSPSTQH